ncbi:hypothetical protein LSAT2_003991 [Lamellibrachia satsuma]|nr:hypothetical protein LSAT2_003991 [Lamellibrachia satsuma]
MADTSEIEEKGKRPPRKHDMLKMYYGISQDGTDIAELTSTPCDLNGVNFEPDTYLGKLLKERSLTELMDKESEMVRDIKALDSDMQTLVYENYNKFISATDTIRKMYRQLYSDNRSRALRSRSDLRTAGCGAGELTLLPPGMGAASSDLSIVSFPLSPYSGAC